MRIQLRRFIDNEIIPHVLEWDEAGRTPRELMRRVGELGFLGIRHPEEYGGSNLSTLASIVFAEELGRSGSGGVAATILVHSNLASPYLTQHGTPGQIRKYISRILSGDLITGIAVTEPNTGSDVAGLKTRAVRDGNGWRLNGAKMYISNGVYGDLFIVAARTDPGGKPSRSISLFLVERETPGVIVSKPLKKLGWRASDTASLTFDDVGLPAESLLGEKNKGFYAIMQNFTHERLCLGALATGHMACAIEKTIEYIKQRTTFGKPLSERQAIRHELARLAAEVEASRQLVYHAAWLDAKGADVTKEASMVKALSAELANKVTYKCLQFHGAFGFMEESGMELLARDARLLSIGGGATEVMLEVIAKCLID
jgi:acyl-CoA dehydrogenase